MIQPSLAQLLLLSLATAAFVASGVGSIMRSKLVALGGQVLGIALGNAVLIWHLIDRRAALPLGDNFDTLLSLGLLLAICLTYVQVRRPLAGLDWFVTPLVVVLLIAAGLLGRFEPQEYVSGTWNWVHRATAYSGAAAFALAAAGGAMYVITARKLRSKQHMSSDLGSLERLEHLTMLGVTLGFALLSIGAVTGFIKIFADHRSTSTPKIVLALAAWLIYAVVLHAPINPSFRGKKVAVLSIFGFLLMACTIITVLLLPEARS